MSIKITAGSVRAAFATASIPLLASRHDLDVLLAREQHPEARADH